MNKPVLTIRKVQESSLYVLLFLLPFSKAAIEIGFGVLLVGWLVERVRGSTRSDSVWVRARLAPLGVGIGLYLAVCGLSIVVSDYPALSMSGFVNKWLEYLLFLVIVADVGARPGIVKRSLAVIACSSLFVVIEAASQQLFGKGLFRGYAIGALGKFPRITGPYENPIDLATYLMVVILLLFPYALTRRSTVRRTLGILLLILLVLCLAQTEAVGAWLGFTAGFLVLLGFQRPLRRYGLLLLMELILASGVVLYQSGHIGSIFSLSDIGKTDRRVMWQAAIGMIRDRPMLGHGLNTFMANYLKYWVGGERMPRYAHNCYLQVASETGLIGLCAFLVLLGFLFARFCAGLRRAAGDDRARLAGFLCGLVAFAVQAAVDTNFYSLRQAALFWVVSGLALGLSERVLRGGSPESRSA